MINLPTIPIILSTAIVLICTSAIQGAETKVDFTRQVRPILIEKCFRCHGPDEGTREAELRLDVRERALAVADSGARAIVPGDSSTSAVVARIFSDDEEERMPPADSGFKLDAEEKRLLKVWIEQGASYQQHWAYVVPTEPELPTGMSMPSWIHNGVDVFILKRLDKEKLQPSEKADRYAMVRRLSLDLTGLPPQLDAVERFVQDGSRDAYERLVDRLLASPAFGERWARVWLDLARYADSAGYAQDPPRTIWRYRDWVIQAINDNLPFDQFTIDQIAGDLLTNPTPSQLLATAFHRNTMTNSEGGTDDEEFRNAAIVDRVNTTMQVWMGMTMGCAQCHSHKYDPISQEEYFRFFAILNSTEDADRGNESPTFATLSLQQRIQQDRLNEEIAKLEKLLAENAKPSPKEKKQILKGPLQARFVRVEMPRKQVFLSLAEVQVFSGEKNLALAGKASQINVAYDGPPKLAIDGNTNGDYFAAKSTTHTAKADNPWWEVDLGSVHAIDRIVLWNRTDGGTHARLNNFRVIALDEKRQPLWVANVGPAPNPSIKFAMPKSGEQLDTKTKDAIAKYRNGDSSHLTGEAKRIANLKKQLAAIKPIPTPIMKELGNPRKTHMQVRGNFLVKGKEVTPGTPAVFHALPKNSDASRLTLAKWLVDRKNPLTARVTVNRIWEHLFGLGIVLTSEDFGVQGQPPSHPQLLDYLAVTLMRQGWDTKELIRIIVTSSTYRQSSRVTPKLLERDPDNRLLARGPRFRMSAEMIRDQALAASGLLSRKMFGESVRPPRPVLGLRAAFGGSTDWKTSTGEDRYRRGLYTSWRRTTPYPSMMTFDATSREVCTIRRIRTNTPLQALVTLNDPVYVEAAQALARLVISGGKSSSERALFGFRTCLSRPPSEAELKRIVRLYEIVLKRFRSAPDQAKMLAGNPSGGDEEIDAAEVAAWTVVGNVLLNLDEVLAKR